MRANGINEMKRCRDRIAEEKNTWDWKWKRG